MSRAAHVFPPAPPPRIRHRGLVARAGRTARGARPDVAPGGAGDDQRGHGDRAPARRRDPAAAHELRRLLDSPLPPSDPAPPLRPDAAVSTHPAAPPLPAP